MAYTINLEEETIENDNFRKVLNTTDKSQLVVMSLLPSEDIGEEVHNVDQFIRVEEGEGRAIIDKEEYDLEDGSAVVIPAGAVHNIVNTGDDDLKLYTIYTPPNHPKDTIHKTKAEAVATEDEEEEE